jgi:hypothetical protein
VPHFAALLPSTDSEAHSGTDPKTDSCDHACEKRDDADPAASLPHPGDHACEEREAFAHTPRLSSVGRRTPGSGVISPVPFGPVVTVLSTPAALAAARISAVVTLGTAAA